MTHHPIFIRDHPNDAREALAAVDQTLHHANVNTSDPLSEIISLLRPRTAFSKRISGAGRWAVRYEPFGEPSFAVVLEGRCRLAVDGHRQLTLEAGDFLLLPTTPGFTMSGFERATPTRIDPKLAASPSGELRHGTRGGKPDVRLLGGYFVLGSPDAPLLVSLLPAVVHLRGLPRLEVLVRLVEEEARSALPGRDLALARLVELLLVEALRSSGGGDAPAGLLRALADPRLSPALRALHRHVARSWTVPELAKVAGLSRSTFFDRFTRTVGVAPMEYALAWRMALAKDLLRQGELAVGEVAERVGYGSASAFNTAFSRHVGTPPGRFARAAG